MLMTNTIRLVLGDQWHPNKIRIQNTDENALANNEFFLNTNIEFGNSATAIALPTLSLATQLSTQIDNATFSKDLYQSITVSDLSSADNLSTLRQLMTSHVRLIFSLQPI